MTRQPERGIGNKSNETGRIAQRTATVAEKVAGAEGTAETIGATNRGNE
jgi:hypothetical protein